MTTSEFNDVKGRLAMLHNRRKIDNKDPNLPQLRGPGLANDHDRLQRKPDNHYGR